MKRVYGVNHPRYARCLDDLAMLYCESEDRADAGPLAREAAEILKRAVGESHPYFAMSLNRLARVHCLMGDFAEAEPLAHQALEVQGQVLGKAHPSYAETLRTLAWLHQGKGDLTKAASLDLQALEIIEQAVGKSHPDCSGVLRHLASLAYAAGDYGRAEVYLRPALQIDRRNLELTSAVQSERQQLDMLWKLRSGLDLYLSLAPRALSESAQIYHEVMSWKGAVFARQQRMRLDCNRPGTSPEVARLFAELGQTTSQLAALVFSTADAHPDQAWRDQIRELTEKQERLERDLSAPLLRVRGTECAGTSDPRSGPVGLAAQHRPD